MNEIVESGGSKIMRTPRFSLLAGIGAIVVYLFSSLPFILVIAFIEVLKVDTSNSEDVSVAIERVSTNQWVLIGALVIQCISVVVYAYIVSLVRGTKNPFRDFGIKFSLDSIYFIFAGVLLQLVGILISIPLQLLYDQDSEQQVVSSVKESSAIAFLIFAVLVGIVVPFCEELCFRGIFQKGLSKLIRPTYAVLTSGVLFALVHLADPGAFLGFPILLMVGIALSVLANRRGKIDASIALHVGFNLTTVAILAFSRYA